MSPEINGKISKLDKIIQRSLEHLKKYSSLNPKVLQDWGEICEIGYSLQVAIQATIDIGARLIAIYGFATCEHYADIPKELFRRNVIEDALARRMEDIFKFRNVLVHMYDELDIEKFIKHVQEDPAWLKLFMQKIFQYTRNHQP